VTGEIVTVFRSRLREDAGDDYERTAAEMEQRARSMPGFVDFKLFVADDGERVSLIVFASRSAHDAWRDDPEHRAAQRRGREEWYASYSIQVAELLHERRLP
jgi:heme-degrading monooxygenase HmoA